MIQDHIPVIAEVDMIKLQRPQIPVSRRYIHIVCVAALLLRQILNLHQSLRRSNDGKILGHNTGQRSKRPLNLVHQLEHGGNCTVVQPVQQSISAKGQGKHIADIKGGRQPGVGGNAKEAPLHTRHIILLLQRVRLLVDLVLRHKSLDHQQIADGLLHKGTGLALRLLDLLVQTL